MAGPLHIGSRTTIVGVDSGAFTVSHALNQAVPAEGDLLVCMVFRWVPSGTPSITPPATWTQRVALVSGLTALYVFTRPYMVGMAASSQFTADAVALGEVGYTMSAYRRVDLAAPVNAVSATGYTTADTILRGVGITTTKANTKLLWLAGMRHTSTTISTYNPVGMTARTGLQSENLKVRLSDLALPAAGVTGNKDGALSAALGDKNAVLLALAEKPLTVACYPWTAGTTFGYASAKMEREITRPLTADTSVRVTDASRNLLAVVPAKVRWTQVLDGSDRLDSVALPKWFLRQNGLRVSRSGQLQNGWLVKFSGVWYTLDRLASDEETQSTITGRSIEASEWKRIYCSTTANPFLQIAKTPTEIMAALLSGSGELIIPDPHFENIDRSILADWSRSIYRWTDDDFNDFTSNAPLGLIGGHAAQFTFGAGSILTPVDRDTYLSPDPLFGAGAGAQMTFAFDAKLAYAAGELALTPVELWANQHATGSTFGVTVIWYAPDQTEIVGTEEVLDISDGLTASYQRFSCTFNRRSDYFRVCFHGFEDADGWEYPDGYVRVIVDDCALTGEHLAEDSGWRYYGALDKRTPDVLHTDAGWIDFGIWDVGAADIYSSRWGDELARIITGPSVAVHFNAGGAGALATIVVDGVVSQRDVDVSADTVVTVSGLDESVEHILTIVVSGTRGAGAGTVRVEKLVLDPANRITVQWSDMNIQQCLDAMLQVTGGELAVDTEHKRIYHAEAHGEDLREKNILELRRGANVTRLDVEHQRGEVQNRLLYLGYGEGSTRLRITVDAISVDEAGDTSQDVYGIQVGTYENPEQIEWYLGYLEARKIVEERCWPSVSYRLSVLDEAAAYMIPGDTVRLYWDADPDAVIDVAVRVLEITRDNEGGPATLLVGSRIAGLADRLTATARKLDALTRGGL